MPEQARASQWSAGRRVAMAWGVGALLLSACGGAQGSLPEGVEVAPVQVAEAAQQPTASVTPAPLPTPTLEPSPTANPPHPLMIEVMRQQEYPGSDITLEEVLDPEANYDRYVVSYLSEGNKIYAYMTIPRGEMPPGGWPVIIFNHGYIPPSQYRTTERYVYYQHGFANSGYIVFRSDYRGHGSSEGIAEGGYSSPAYTVDVLNGMASVKRLSQADANRIGMWGHSMGGQITLRAMVVSPDIKAGVIWGGVVASYADLLELWRRPRTGPTPTPNPARTRDSWRIQLVEAYGYPIDNPVFWASISPNTYVRDLSGPLQLHHATGDQSVPFALSEILYSEVLAAGMPVELFLYEGDDHDITDNFTLAMQRSIQHFDTYVKGSG